jgi:hypothetical protein
MQAQQPHPNAIWETLPDEAKLHILGFLPPEHLANVHPVNHQMDQMATQVEVGQIAQWAATFRELRERIDLISTAMDIDGMENEFGPDGVEGQSESLSTRLSELTAQATDFFGCAPEEWANHAVYAELYGEWSAAAGMLHDAYFGI